VPIYEYKCEECEYEFEEFQSIKEPPVESCPKCKGKVKKVISMTSFSLKGDGWAKSGYSKNSCPTKKG
jgi:putative FmdB family regulatory protein